MTRFVVVAVVVFLGGQILVSSRKQPPTSVWQTCQWPVIQAKFMQNGTHTVQFLPKKWEGLEESFSRDSPDPHPSHIHHEGVDPSYLNKPFSSQKSLFFSPFFFSVGLSEVVSLSSATIQNTSNSLPADFERIRDDDEEECSKRVDCTTGGVRNWNDMNWFSKAAT